MPQCQFPVFCYFVFKKSYTGNILGIGQTEDRNSYFSRTKDEDRKRAGGGPEGRLTKRGRAPLLAVPRGGEATLVALRRRPSAYKKPSKGKP
jgi:hypothetical protein